MTIRTTPSDLQQLHTEEEPHANDAIDLRVYLKAVRKHRWTIMLTTAFLTGAAALLASEITPTYRATTTLLIEPHQALPMNVDKIIGIDTKNSEYFQTQFEALRSRKLARRVISESSLYDHPELTNPELDQKTNPKETKIASTDNSSTSFPEIIEVEKRKVVERFIARTKITPVKGTKMVRISFDSPDPVFAASVANKIADTYIVNYTDSRAEMSEKANELLNERLNELKIRLEQSQRRLLNYKEANGFIGIQGDNNRLGEQEIGIITSKLLDAESEASNAKILYDEVTNTKTQGIDALLSLPSIDSNEMVRKHKFALQESQLHLDELKNRYGDKHPRVVDATSRKNTATSNLDSQMRNLVDSTEKKYILARQTVDSLRAMLNEGKEQLQKSDRSSLELLHLEREVQLNQNLFDDFYTRSREVDEAGSIRASNAQIEEYAEPPLHPVSPKIQLITLLTFLLSAAAAMLIALLRESTDNSITSTDDVELKLGTRMLGILPLVKGKKQSKNKSNVLEPGSLSSESHAFEESVRTIRTSICLDDLQQKNQVIMVTSALPSEGKSTLASHLAYSLSSIETVLLIDCDLRRPSLQDIFCFSNNYGLTQLIAGEAKPAMCIKPRAIGNLDVIPAGRIAEKPLDLLTARRFNQLMEIMRQRYDRIIIDSAPVQAVSDALILGRHADSVLYTVKANSTSADVAARGVKRLKEAGIQVTGAVVTQVNLKKESYGGELNYQGYYDYYGYSSLNESAFSEGLENTRKNEAA